MVLVALPGCGRADRGESGGAATPGESPPPGPVSVETTTVVVNQGSPGMAARTRWLFSEDSTAILVVEDPAGVEAEPVPNGFVFASERLGRIVQRDSAWDVAPSPDWSRVAWGRAFGPRPGERDSLTQEEWREFAASLPTEVADAIGPRRGTPAGRDSLVDALRRRAFPSSGMTYAVAIGVAHVLDVAAGEGGTPLRWDGWRVAWTRDGTLLGIGTDPTGVQDDSPPRRWILVRPPAGDSVGAAAGHSRFAALRWMEGPVLDVSIDEPPRELAATRGRQFVVALVPNPGAGEFDRRTRLVVHHIRPR